MRLLCDENVPLAVERALVAAGHDVVAIRTLSPGAADTTVLQHAIRDGRALITYDRDFGALLFQARLRPAPAVLYVRTARSPSADGPRVLQALAYTEVGYIVVLDDASLRKRSLDPDELDR